MKPINFKYQAFHKSISLQARVPAETALMLTVRDLVRNLIVKKRHALRFPTGRRTTMGFVVDTDQKRNAQYLTARTHHSVDTVCAGSITISNWCKNLKWHNIRSMSTVYSIMHCFKALLFRMNTFCRPFV
jgi:glutamine amidotransferase PdxT